jgi:hypothetical protein
MEWKGDNLEINGLKTENRDLMQETKEVEETWT